MPDISINGVLQLAGTGTGTGGRCARKTLYQGFHLHFQALKGEGGGRLGLGGIRDLELDINQSSHNIPNLKLHPTSALNLLHNVDKATGCQNLAGGDAHTSWGPVWSG